MIVKESCPICVSPKTDAGPVAKFATPELPLLVTADSVPSQKKTVTSDSSDRKSHTDLYNFITDY